jgi:hypothetical protein
MADLHRLGEAYFTDPHCSNRKIAVLGVSERECLRAKTPERLEYAASIANVAGPLMALRVGFYGLLVKAVPRDRADRAGNADSVRVAIEILDGRRYPPGERNRIVVGE